MISSMHRGQSTLRRRLIALIGVMVLGVALLGVAAVAGINALQGDLGTAARGYRELRQVYEVGVCVTAARQALGEDRQRAIAAIDAAVLKASFSDGGPDAPAQWLDEGDRAKLTAALGRLHAAVQAGASVEAAEISNQLMGRLADIAAKVRTAVAQRETSAEHRRQVTLGVVLVIAGILTGVVIAAGVRLYRAVAMPLDAIGRGVRRFAGRDWNARVEMPGDAEFAALAKEFNRMAGELQGVYSSLEEKVAAASRELAQAERLASVGYLAAGVAHEINNPLAIIAGYGERSIDLLGRNPVPTDAAVSKTREALAVICEEAFRCKQITDRLLSLARPGRDGEGRAEVSLADVAKDVVSSVAGLGRFANRRLALAVDSEQDLKVMGRAGELKQVMLNLITNGLEATAADGGEVRVAITRHADVIELSVSDNGRGMSRQTTERVFEPFFTEKRGAADAPGTGLGLSISHAIVREHGGSLSAESDGIGHGSRFTLRLPAAVCSEAAVKA